MYKSPVEKIYGKLQTQIVQEDEKMVMKAIRKVGVNVDKGALIKALQYDRNQYTKGYEDGKNEVLDKIRVEIGKSKTKHEMQIAEKDIKAKLLISDIYCDIVNILDKYKPESEEP